jgi:peptide/nickel transport system substrate-binding protein
MTVKQALRTMLLATALGAGLLGSASAATLVVAQNFDPQTLWPNGTTASDNLNAGSAIVEALFWVDPKGEEFKPLLATGYELESDTSVIVRLREGVRFSNGEPMNADAVIHSFNVFVDTKQTPAYSRVSDPFQSIEKIDDLTVRMTLKYPYPPLRLALSQMYITPPGYWNEVGLEAYGLRPIGTGPFVFESWARDDRLVMTANPDYWGERPQGIDSLVWRPVPDEIARSAGLMTGEYDIASSLPVTAALEVEARPDLTMVPVPSYRIYQVILSSLPNHVSPLQDRKVRQALNHAIDKQSIIDNLLFGYGVPLRGQVLREPQLGFNPELEDYPFDQDRARALLAEAGFPSGFTIDFKFPAGRYAQDREVSEAVAGMLGEVGVKTNMIVLEPGEFLRQLRASELWPMAYVGLAPQDDPDLQVSQYHSTWRYSYIQNAELDRLIDTGRQEMNVEARAAIYRDAMTLMREEAPIIFLFGGVDFYGTSARVQNFSARGDGRFFFYGVSAN